MTFFGNGAFEAIMVEMRSHWSRKGLDPMCLAVLIRKGQDTKADIERTHVSLETQAVGMQLQAKDDKNCQLPPEAGRGKEKILPRVRASSTLLTP